MRALRIDFAARPLVRDSRFYALIGSLALAAFAGTEAYSGHLNVEQARIRLQAARPHATDVRTNQSTPPLTAKQAKAVNDAIQHLNLPWERWLAVFDAERYGAIGMLSLHPDSTNQALTMTAEARAENDMIEFVRKLQDDPLVAQAVLVHHEINTADANKPVRFAVEVRWKASP